MHIFYRIYCAEIDCVIGTGTQGTYYVHAYMYV